MNIMPAFPDLTPDMTTSFTSAYEHQTVPLEHHRRARTNSSGAGSRTPHVHLRRRQEDARSSAHQGGGENDVGGAGSGEEADEEPRRRTREGGSRAQGMESEGATRRILLGLRRAGTEQARESEDLSDQEEAVYHQELATRNFGAEFLLPIGRRQTQVEADYPASETPSDAPEQEHRQEDQELDVPSPLEMVDDPNAPVADLDDEMEDRDREDSGEDASGAMEE